MQYLSTNYRQISPPPRLPLSLSLWVCVCVCVCLSLSLTVNISCPVYTIQVQASHSVTRRKPTATACVHRHLRSAAKSFSPRTVRPSASKPFTLAEITIARWRVRLLPPSSLIWRPYITYCVPYTLKPTDFQNFHKQNQSNAIIWAIVSTAKQ